MMKLADFNHPFYKPLWLRLLIVGGTVVWSAFEFWMGAPAWGALIGAICAYSFYGLFVAFDPREPEKGGSENE